MSLVERTTCCLIVATFAFIVAQAQDMTGETYANTGAGELWTTTEATTMVDQSASSTTVAPGIGVNKLIALIVLGSVLGFLLLAVLTCGCWLCRKMRRRANPKERVIIDGHYTSKSQNDGSRTKVIAVRENVYRAKPEPFWGVQHAVAEAVNSPYGGSYGGPSNDGQMNYGYSPYGAGSRAPNYP